MSKHEALIASLSNNLQSVRPAVNIDRVAMAWLLASAGYVVIITHLLGPIRPNALHQLMAEPRFLIETLSGVLAIIVGTLVAFRTSVPGALHPRWAFLGLLFDSLWGDTHDFPEDEVKGWMIAGAEYREYDGFDPRLRIRVRAPLPNLNSRWDLILGRVDETSFVSDTQTDDAQFFNPGAVNQQDEEAEWLLGLGHRGSSRKKGWDWSAGVRLRTPPNPYAKVQYYYNKDFSDNKTFNFRQTFFWRGDDGFGLTSRGDFLHEIDPGNHLRYEGIITHSEETQGNEWYFGTTWFHRFEGKNGISLLAFANGESEAEEPLKDFGFNLIWRRPFTRDWMYLSMGPSLTWPREFKSEEREMSLGFGVWLEIEFGDWRY